MASSSSSSSSGTADAGGTPAPPQPPPAPPQAPADLDASADGAIGRCPGATYTTAPSGGACDPERIERAGSFDPACSGPPLGVGCDRLQVSLPQAEAASLPAGWTCGSPELGVVTCMWSFADDASVHTLDAAALDAACAVTVARPDANVVCAIHGS